MRSAAIVVALCGCNQVFDVRETVHVDAAPPPDGIPDARIACPSPNTEPPHFGPSLTQTKSQFCASYTISADTQRSLGICYTPSLRESEIYEGRVDEEMAPVAVVGTPAGYFIEEIRLSPEGDEAIAKLYEPISFNYRDALYRRAADGTWSYAGSLGITLTYSSHLSSPTRAPARRLFLSDPDDVRYQEYVESSPGTWTLAQTYVLPDFGISLMFAPSLSPDGLRMVFYGRDDNSSEDRVLYVDRTDPMARFRKVVPLGDVPPVFAPVLTEDCGRLYFNALDSLFYLTQVTP